MLVWGFDLVGFNAGDLYCVCGVLFFLFLRFPGGFAPSKSETDRQTGRVSGRHTSNPKKKPPQDILT